MAGRCPRHAPVDLYGRSQNRAGERRRMLCATLSHWKGQTMSDIKSRALALFGKGRAVATTETVRPRPASSGLDVLLSGAARVPAPAVAPPRTAPRRQRPRL